MEQIRKLRKELIISIVSVIVAAVALSSSTYAWYVTNNMVKAKTSTITATTNGFILQITTPDKGVQHGGSQESLTAFSKGEVLSPASTDAVSYTHLCQRGFQTSEPDGSGSACDPSGAWDPGRCGTCFPEPGCEEKNKTFLVGDGNPLYVSGHLGTDPCRTENRPAGDKIPGTFPVL